MPPDRGEPPIVVFTPMEVERAAVAAAIEAADLASHVDLVRTGIGRDRVLAALNTVLVRRRSPPALVILAGCAGGLTDLDLDARPAIAMIVDEQGREWTPAVIEPGEEPVAVLGVDRLIDEPRDKRRLHELTGASLVDMESHAFAARCGELDWPWAVVRGVSDGPDHRVPPIILSWINPDGTSRTGKALRDLLVRPWLWAEVSQLVQHTQHALALAGEGVVTLTKQALERVVHAPR